MEGYILDRMRADAAHVLALSANEAKLDHPGLVGRFREILIDNLMSPWLPPYAACGTGMIIAAEHVSRASTQDDIVIYDTSLAPPVMASRSRAPEGVFLYNSVLARIEVKSTLKRKDIANFVRSSVDISQLSFSTQPSFDKNQRLTKPFNLLFAYTSDAEGKDDPNLQVKRLLEVMKEEKCDPLSGIVSMLCIAGCGFWKLHEIGGRRCWVRLNQEKPEDGLAWFTACVSNTCYRAHAERQGRDAAKGLETGIGSFLAEPYEEVN